MGPVLQQIWLNNDDMKILHPFSLNQRRIQRRRAGRAPPCLKIFMGVFLEILTS